MTNLNLPAKTDSTIRELFEASVIQDQIAKALPSALSVERLTRIMLTTFRTNKGLLNCSQHSLLACFFGCAQLGLTPEPWLGQAYLVPFWSSKLGCNEATLIPGYRGLITLARRSGELRTVKAAAVYKNEPFEWDRLNPERSKHGYVVDDPGEMIGAWTLWTFKDQLITGDFMTNWEIDKIMQRTKSRNKKGEIVGPWETDKAEMAKKTVIRRHFKLAPVSVEDTRQLSTAIQAENIAIGQGPEAQRNLFLPDLSVPEPQYTVDDFDNEFSDIMRHPLYSDFWNMAVGFHSDEHGMTEDELKVDIMATGAGAFHESFVKHVNSASAKDAKADPPAETVMRNEPAYNTPPKQPTPKEKLIAELDHFLKTEPQIVAEESGGKTPKTIAEYTDLLDRINARVDEKAGMPRA